MTDLARLAAAGVGINADTPPDRVGQILADWMGYAAKVRDLDKQIRAMVIKWCEDTGKVVPAGDAGFWKPGYRTEKSCTDVKATAAALLEHASLETLMECLTAQAFKPGACKAHLPDEVYAGLFREEVKATLKNGEKAEKQLVKIDPKFVKQRPGHGAAGQQDL